MGWHADRSRRDHAHHYTDSSHPYYPTGREDPLGNSLDYTYALKGNITKITNDLEAQNTLLYTYATKGMVSKVTDARGNATTYSYDFKRNLTKITSPSLLGVVTITRDALSRVSSITDGKGQKATYTYDDAGNLTSVTDAAGTVNYAYHAANLLTTLTEPGGGLQTTFTSDANHNRTSTAYPNGVTMTMTYDASRRLTEITGKDGSGTVLTSYCYRYADPVTGYDTHLRQTMTDTAGNVTTYTYDVLDRLLRAETKGSGGTVIDDYQYTYDGAGNRLTQTVNGTTTT